MILKEQTILITGASTGIGEQIALQLAKENSKLILLGRNLENLESVKEQALSLGSAEVTIYAFDLTDRNTVTDNLEKIRESHKDLTVIINNAGIWQPLNDVDQFNHDDIENIINTNITSLIKVTNTLLPVLRTQKEGAIINISSQSGVKAMKGQSIYSASKWGVKGFTDVLKEDLKGSGIRVSGVYQGGTRTNFFTSSGVEPFPMDHYTDPKDLAETVVFMLSRQKTAWIDEIHVTKS